MHFITLDVNVVSKLTKLFNERITSPHTCANGGYQHFWWKGIYTSLHALNAFEKYIDENKEKIGNGYTLYLNFHLGYQFNFLKKRFFFEPAIGCSYWPIRTNVPASFKVVEERWNNYFIQPGLHFGYNFDIKKKSKH